MVCLIAYVLMQYLRMGRLDKGFDERRCQCSLYPCIRTGLTDVPQKVQSPASRVRRNAGLLDTGLAQARLGLGEYYRPGGVFVSLQQQEMLPIQPHFYLEISQYLPGSLFITLEGEDRFGT